MESKSLNRLACHNGCHGFRLQSAMEYLMTYGWAILILGVVVAAIWSLGLFSPSTFVSSQCIMPAEFSCLSAVLSQGGSLFINIEQSTASPILITGIGCNTNATYQDMSLENFTLPIASNTTFTIQCYSGTSPFSGSIGSLYHGYLMINYTDIQTGFPKLATGTLILKVT
ncbi:MAG: hypothetical protein M1279_02000 [Candidatus Marsarchaeota archaeon]|nr:hypothetical protein [Candidatus Marsarchaeota archaeon]